ncbi:Alpha-(1,3)-fucosyltransferase 11 [Stylosanthes scabra]|uniref:Alpha-(1,3)-fucosyltransferase 11 n=1 Tax=Stylosanthes scabra TaxID=79078 RepID=A0ABU6VHU9_9FABA|nr:Alpha-(1,3)-fucosyltransferase 11 [Stylosanthes scabra]
MTYIQMKYQHEHPSSTVHNSTRIIAAVVGAPNIHDFAVLGSILHIKEIEDVESVAKTMRHLAENPEEFNQSLRWKYEGPADSFKALVDMTALHRSCRF